MPPRANQPSKMAENKGSRGVGCASLLPPAGLQPTDAKPGPAFIKRFCGFHKPEDVPSGLYGGLVLDSQQTERPATLTTFASLRFAQMRLSARPSRSPSRYDRLRF